LDFVTFEMFQNVHEKNRFRWNKNLALYIYIYIYIQKHMKITWLNHQNNDIGHSNMTSNAIKNFDILATSLRVLYNYFNAPLKLFSDLYLTEFSYFSKTILFVYIIF